MTRARLMVPLVIAAVWSSPLAAQQRIDARTAVFFESYSFNTGLVFDRITEITIPIGANGILWSVRDSRDLDGLRDH